MKIEEIGTEELQKAGWNYKTDSEVMAMKLVENIKRNGVLQTSLIYESEGELIVLDGNHRLDAYRALGIKKVPCINLGAISQAQAERISIEINETRFDNDPVKLSEAIKNINLEFDYDDMELTMPYSKEELQSMAELLDTDWDSEDEMEDVEFQAKIKRATCPECGHEFEV